MSPLRSAGCLLCPTSPQKELSQLPSLSPQQLLRSPRGLGRADPSRLEGGSGLLSTWRPAHTYVSSISWSSCGRRAPGSAGACLRWHAWDSQRPGEKKEGPLELLVLPLRCFETMTILFYSASIY